LDSVNAQAEVGKHILQYAGKSFGALKETSLGKKILGIAAYPLMGGKLLAQKQAEAVDEYGDISKTQEEIQPVEKTPLEKIRSAVIEKFSIGDLISVSGLGMYFLQNSIGPEKPGIIGGLFKNLSLLMTFLGSTSAGIGRALGFDKEFMYGEEQAIQMLEDAKTQGKTIFTIIDGAKDSQRINEIKTKAKILDKTLIYKDGLRESILERHEQNQIGGIFDGPHGTGKTAGVECILGKWADKVQREGDIPVIAELNLANFDEYVSAQKQKQRETLEFFEYFADSKGNTKGTFATNQGLMVLELLIRKIQKIRKNIDEYNKKTDGPKKKLAIFADEFDKALQTSTLKGCDKIRLRNLLIQFNEIFVKEDLLLTSNTKLEDMMKDLSEHVKIDDKNTGQAEVIGPMRDRLSAKNRSLIEFPAASEQARIIAGRVLVDYPKDVDWQDFGGEFKRTGNFEFDRELFGEVIEREITSKLQTKINGRQLANACEQLKSMLLGKARQINSQKRLFDDKTWSQMKAADKIARTGAKIDRLMLKQVVGAKLQNMNLDQSEKDLDFSIKLVDSYLTSKPVAKILKDNNVKLAVNSGNALDDTLESVYEKRTNDSNIVFVAKDLVDFNGRKYQHVITQYPGADSSLPSYSLAFADVTDKSIDKLTMYDFVSSKRISASHFADEIVPVINRAATNPLQKAMDSLIGAFTGAGFTGGDVKLKEEDIKTIASEAVKNLLGQAA
jgi:hypothetical protein